MSFQNLRFKALSRIITLTLCISFVGACGNDPHKPEVVNGRGGQHDPNRDKLEEQTGVALPSLTALAFLPLKQVRRLLSIALERETSPELKCVRPSFILNDDKKSETVSINHRRASGCLNWSGQETFVINYTDESRSTISKIIKNTRSTDDLIYIDEKSGIFDVKARMLEFVEITLTNNPGVFSFNYNTDNFNSPDITIEYTRSNKKPSDGNKKDKTRDQEAERAARDRMDRFEEDQSAPQRDTWAYDRQQDNRDQNRRDSNKMRRGNAPGGRARQQVYYQYVWFGASGFVNMKTDKPNWSISKALIKTDVHNANGKISSSSVDLTAPSSDFLMQNECSVPLTNFNAYQSLETNDGRGKKNFENQFLVQITESAIMVPNYFYKHPHPVCNRIGYAYFNDVIVKTFQEMLKTKIFQGSNGSGKTTGRRNTLPSGPSGKDNATDKTKSKDKDPANKDKDKS